MAAVSIAGSASFPHFVHSTVLVSRSRIVALLVLQALLLIGTRQTYFKVVMPATELNN